METRRILLTAFVAVIFAGSTYGVSSSIGAANLSGLQTPVGITDVFSYKAGIKDQIEKPGRSLTEQTTSLSVSNSQTDCTGMKMEKGTVKWFNDAKGYGYITRAKGADVYVHYSEIKAERSQQTLKEGERVRFAVVNGPMGLVAKCVVKTGK